MMRKFMTLAAAATLALGAMAPAAQARDDHWGGWNGHHNNGGWNGNRYYGGGRYHGYGHGDAVAAGVVGLILGLAVGSAASAPRRDYGGCYDRCGPPPPPQYRGYDPGRGDDGSAYDQDYYGAAPPKDGGYPQSRQCSHSVRQWDSYANRYVTVDVPC